MQSVLLKNKKLFCYEVPLSLIVISIYIVITL
jgi:hypothetical protein